MPTRAPVPVGAGLVRVADSGKDGSMPSGDVVRRGQCEAAARDERERGQTSCGAVFRIRQRSRCRLVRSLASQVDRDGEYGPRSAPVADVNLSGLRNRKLKDGDGCPPPSAFHLHDSPPPVSPTFAGAIAEFTRFYSHFY